MEKKILATLFPFEAKLTGTETTLLAMAGIWDVIDKAGPALSAVKPLLDQWIRPNHDP